MDHQVAVRDKVAERYLLGELNDTDREAFEEHYFVCESCAEDVRHGAGFISAARAVLRDEARAPAKAEGTRTRKWWDWLWNPMPAYGLAAVLALVAVVQRSTLPPAFHPQFISTVDLRPATRGAAQVIFVREGQQMIQVTAAVPAEAAYVCTLTDARNSVVAEMETPVLQKPEVSLLIPAEHIGPGRYRLAVRGRGEPAKTYNEEFEFEIQR